MTITEQRDHALELLAKVDDEFFAAVYAMLETYVRLQEDLIIGYDADGEAIRASIAKVQFAEDLSKPEEFITIEDFEQEMETEAAV